MAVEATSSDLIKVVSLLGVAVVMVPLFRRLGLGSVLGYLCAGLIIGPFGFGWFADSHAVLHVAELGVVMFLFVIGLEMQPSHLWSLRRDIFGLGSLQIFLCTLLLTGVGLAFGFKPATAFIGGMGFVLTSTAIVMQLLGERGDINLPRGQKMVSILLFEDLLIVPLLALVVVMSPIEASTEAASRWVSIGLAGAALAALVAAGLWLLNPLFRILALAKAREVMTAAALFVVLGSALLMQMTGLSMAMGAFLAGVLLAESSFRHQIEADIEPFRGILLGLFFIGVGMSLDVEVVRANLLLVAGGAVVMMAVKGVAIYLVARFLKSSRAEALDRATLMAQGGEFAFVLYAAAAAEGVIDATANANFTAIVVLSMVFTPLVVLALGRLRPAPGVDASGVEAANGLTGNVLLIGFGRFGQVVSQLLLARDVNVTIIDADPDMIRSAAEFGFKIYYGDGSRLDVLRASGAGTADAIVVAIDEKELAKKVVALVKSEFPQAKLLVRAYDRVTARELILEGVDYQIRETFESAVLMGEHALLEIGVSEEDVVLVSADIRRRDRERMQLDIAAGNGFSAGRGLMYANARPKPAPLIEPKREAESLTAATENTVKGV